MKHALLPISSLLLSNAFLLLGHGLLLTLLPIVASQLGFTSLQIALTGSAYFLGFVSGCLLTPHILRRVGHIRSFAVLSFYSMLSLLMIMLSQQLFSLGNDEYNTLFVGAAILVALSIIPVSLTLSLAPAPVEDTKVTLARSGNILISP